jgi:hypothetical protein
MDVHLLAHYIQRDGLCLLRGTSWVFKYNSHPLQCSGPCYGSGAQFPASHPWDLGSISCQCMWDFWWIEVALGHFWSNKEGFPLSVPFHQCSTLILIYMLLLPEGQWCRTWELSEKQRCFVNREHWIEKWFFFVSVLTLTHSSVGLRVEGNHTATPAEGLHDLARDNFTFVPHVIFTNAASVFSYRQNPYKMQPTCYQTTRQ